MSPRTASSAPPSPVDRSVAPSIARVRARNASRSRAHSWPIRECALPQAWAHEDISPTPTTTNATPAHDPTSQDSRRRRSAWRSPDDTSVHSPSRSLSGRVIQSSPLTCSAPRSVADTQPVAGRSPRGREQTVTGHRDDDGMRGYGGCDLLQALEAPADDRHARAADRRRREHVELAADRADQRRRHGRRHDLHGLQTRQRRHLDERGPRRVGDDEQITDAVAGHREDPRRGAASQRRPVALDDALDHGRIAGEEASLAEQGLLRVAEEGAGGGDRLGQAHLVARLRLFEQRDAGEDPQAGEDSESEPEPCHGPHTPSARQRRSPTRCSLRRLVVPVTHMGEPEMITSTSFIRTEPSPSKVASTSSIISSVVSTLRISRDDPPHDSARRRWTSTNGVSAMIATSGRSCEMSRAENPDCVNATIARAPSTRAADAAASETASGKPTPTRSCRRHRISDFRAACSARSAMRAITTTASTGYRPVAVSADSMIASAPSKIAVETSETSARVGLKCVTIDSSIWVATMTGTLAARACRITSFWMCGTSSRGTSRPRSPRATMTASTIVRMPGRLATISWRSSLATIGKSAPWSRRNFLTSPMSAAERTNETATKSMP